MKPGRNGTRLGPHLSKVPSGIRGLDEITFGGLPRGRTTLVCGGPGSGKSLLAMQFLVRGALDHGEPGVLVSFEQTAEEIAADFANLGFEVPRLRSRRLLAVDAVEVHPADNVDTGEWSLEPLFLRIGSAAGEVGAKRVVLDSLETLFAGFGNEALLRGELRRLFRWTKDRGFTVVATAERIGEGLTRIGLEEFVSDCVILLDHRVSEQISTRRLRVVKYRGSRHGTNEYPFLVGDDGLAVLPITSVGLDHAASRERVSTGVPSIDAMLGGKGFYRGSSVLLSGTAGTGKTSLAAQFAESVCRRGGRCLFFAYEESVQQLARNMRSIGLDLDTWIRKGQLRVLAARPTLHGLEMHLVAAHHAVRDHRPDAVVVDPISNLLLAGTVAETKAMLTRLVDFLKGEGCTALFTSLTRGGQALEETEVGISSLIDTWILLRDEDTRPERTRTFAVLKSRGMDHSKRTQLLITRRGLTLAPAGGEEPAVERDGAAARRHHRPALRRPAPAAGAGALRARRGGL